MATKFKSEEGSVEAHLCTLGDLTRTQIIVTLGLAGIPQRNIRNILGVDIVRVNRILKEINNGTRKYDKKRKGE